MIFDGAKWISNGVREYVGTVEGVRANPAPYFRKDFTVDKGLVKATLYATAKGVYEAYVNDTFAGDELFTPGFTNYNKLILFQEYDVTEKLHKGKNTFGAVVSEGWYAGHIAFQKRQYFGAWPVCLLMKLVLEYKNGRIEEIVTDSSFKTTTGRILASSILDGEVVDNRLPESYEMFSSGMNVDEWDNATEEGSDFSLLAPQEEEPVRFCHRLKGVCIGHDRGDIYDFGQNAAGVLYLNVKADEDTKITLRHAEMMDGDKLYTANLRLARCEDVFYCRGGRQILTPTFTFHGFRYAEVIVEGGDAKVTDIFFNVCHNDLTRTGEFDCSSELINKIYTNTLWSQRSNFLSVPTDCPQRDERLGWTGDAQIFCVSAMYNADCKRFLARYLRDIRLDQRDNGAVTDIAPDLLGLTGEGTAAWGDAVCVIPYNHYVMYGDLTILEDNIEAMKKWVEYLRTHSTNLIRPAEGYGDWLSVYEETDKSVLATAYFAYSTLLTAKSLDYLGEDSGYYYELYEQVKQAFNAEFVDEQGMIRSDTQTCYLLALNFGLCDDREGCFAHLLRTLERRDNHLTTGFVGVSLLLPTLCEFGREDLAYALILSTDYPSWGFSVKNGATTIWERWNSYTPENGFGDVGMNSFNHYSLGSCVQWMYSYMLGIKPDESAPGFEKLIIKPVTDPLHRVTNACGHYDSECGRIDVDWTDENSIVTLNVYKPADMSVNVDIKGDIISVAVDGEAATLSMVAGAEEITIKYRPQHGGIEI